MKRRKLNFNKKPRSYLDEVLNNRYINLLNEETRKFTISYSYPICPKKLSMKMDFPEEEPLLDFIDENMYEISEADARLKLLDKFGSHEDN